VRFRELFSSHITVIAAAALVASLGSPASAGTTDQGFFDEYLILGPYANSGGAGPTLDYIASDFLCDGDVSEATILPEDLLELGVPEAPGGCATEDTSYAGVDPVVPTVKRQLIGGAFPDIVDFNANLSPNDQMMAYAWVYVENVTNPPRVLNYVMGLASDDSVEVKVNRSQVFSRSIPRWYDPTGTIQDRFPIALLPGGNLIQFKVFEGGGDWGLRARLESTSDCKPILSGDGEIEVTADAVPLAIPPGTATRTIVTSGNTIADITVAVATGGAAYTLKESYDPSWAISNVTGGGVGGAGVVTWTNITAASVGYRLSRVTDYSVAQATLSGTLTVGAIGLPVGGDKVIPGGVAPYVSQVLLTPEMNIGGGFEGCSVTPAVIEGGWVTDGILTDENIVPVEGLEFLPEFGATSQASGWTDGITPAAADLFWTNPADVTATTGKLAKVDSQPGGLFNYNGVYGDQSTCMNVAYFYVENNTGQNPLYLYCGTGSDDSVGVRLNGRPAHTMQACRPNNYFGDKFVAALDPGKNLFAVYVFENGGGFDMTFRFEDESGTPIAIKTTLDPTGYDPDPAKHPVHPLPEPPKPPVYTLQGFITQFLVPRQPFECALAGSTKASALPEDYISIDGNPPDVTNVFEGAPAGAGTTLEISTEIRGAAECGFTPLVLFDSATSRAATAGDPGLFNGELFYTGNPDQYSSTMFCFLRNNTAGQVPAYIGFASDDAGTLFVNGVMVLEFLTPRGYGGANTIQNGPAEVLLEPGLNLVQLSYNEAGGGSGGRIGVWQDCTRTKIFESSVVQPFAVPPDAGGGVTTTRTLGNASCAGSASATLTFTTKDGAPAQVNVREELPVGTTGANPSRGSFNAQGNVLTFTGNINDGDTLTYDLTSGVKAGSVYCLGAVNNRPIVGDSVFKTGTDVCDISKGFYINCGGAQRTDSSDRLWLEDSLSNPSPHLTSPNAYTAVFGTALGLDLDFDPFIAEREYPGQVFPDERWNNGPIEYTFTSLPPGEYEVVLLFMEGCCSDGCDSSLEDPALSAGACRVFDATVNGVFPTNEFSPAIGGADGDQYSQFIAGGNANRIPTHLVARVPVTDGKIVVRIEDLGDTNPPENASIKALGIEKVGDIDVGKKLHRGDTDQNNLLQLTDAVQILSFLFLGTPTKVPDCLDAADADDNGLVQLTDAVRILAFLFLGGPPPAPPGPPPEACGVDSTEDPDGDLGCLTYINC